MPRAKRNVIDNAAELGFRNYGTEWWNRGVGHTYTDEPLAPEEDWLTLSVPTLFLGDGASVDTVTLWGRGLLSFGAPTEAQIAHMATLSVDDDPSAFLAGFPGGFIDVGFQPEGYGSMELGQGARDFIANPLGSFFDPFDPTAGLPIFDRAQARGYAYVAWADSPLSGTAEDWEYIDDVPIGPGSYHGIEFAEEGFLIGRSGGTLRLGGATVALSGDAFVYYSDLNAVDLSGGADVAAVTGGPEALHGLGGDDRLTGGAHADALHGGDGADVLLGGLGIDRLFGGDGNDDLSDGDEQGQLWGGAGDDVLRPGRGEDMIDGGDGIDRIVVDYSGWGSAIAFTLDPGRVDYMFPDAYKTLTGVEAMTFTAGSGRDTLTGASADDVLLGEDGQDHLIGNDGADVLSGGRHRDYLEGGAGDDWLDGGTGEGPVVFTENNYRSYDLDANPDLLVVGEQQDYGYNFSWQSEFTFTATSENPQLWIDLSPLTGEQLEAYYYVSIDRELADGSRVTLVSQSHYGTDVYQLQGIEPWDYPDYPPIQSGDRFFVSIYSDDDDGGPFAAHLRLLNVPVPDGDTMLGGTGDDTFVVNSVHDRVVEYSGEGFDTVVTTLATYSLAGVAHVERLIGEADTQTLTGNGLNNAIVSRGSGSTLDGGIGDDRLVISATPALVEGGDGFDRLVVRGRAGTAVSLSGDQLSGVELVTVAGGNALDLSGLNTAPGQIRLLAGGGSVVGADGSDRIFGSAQDDVIAGGLGADVLTGRGGADRFVFRLGDTPHDVESRDRITDFAAAEGDRIDVSAMSEEGFAFLGTGAFSGAAEGPAELRLVVRASGVTVVQIDLDHDARADASFLVRTDAPLTVADFVF